ncbi:TonB-dependent receptor [Gimibacter soli]|uniref:TonB-dependent receptor n=1 Tax=Gimibacter soli TaxID=3024400 RepID=A0AAF0BLR8_9PROT|nr:TonB-dependent receptor [Gimibacter soli]WCL53446.1 TonB-dependent receptor [Gimibacter soli]
MNNASLLDSASSMNKEGFAGAGMRRLGLSSSVAAYAILAVLAGNAAQAQEQGGADADTEFVIDEIVVSATKTGARALSDVPMAIQAFSGDSLAARNIREGAELIKLIPGASQAQEIGAGYRIFSFRGSGAGGPVGDGMVGYYLDDTPFGVPNFQAAPPLQYFDIERVEVLRGPQGTLYGQGSMGGVIIYRTKNPDLEEFGVEGELSLSKTKDADDFDYRGSAAVSIPVVKDKLAIRISGSYDFRAGYNDIYEGAPTGTPLKTDANDIKAENIQAVVLWKPSDQLTLRMRGWHFSTDQDYLNVMDSVDPPYAANQGTFEGYDKRSANYFSNTITYDFDTVTLTNATSYQRSLPGGFGVGLGLGAPLGTGILINGGDAKNFVNEFRLASSDDGPFHWVGGMFYQNAKGVYEFSLNFPTLALGGETITRTENGSIFSEISYDMFGGKLVPLFGLRYFKDSRSSDSVSNGVPAASDDKLDAWTWRANLAYHASDDWMLFINAGTGFRSSILQSQAQADAVIADGVPSDISLTPDKLRNIEIGAKGSLFDNRLQVAASVYDIKYTNLQSAFNTSIGLSAFANLGDGKTQGIDAEIQWMTPIEGLRVNAIANYNSSEFTNVIPAFAEATPRAANGERLFNTPPYNVRFDLDYSTTVGDWEMTANASATFNGKAKNQDATVDELDAYELYDASIAFRRDQYEFRLFGSNLSDLRGPTSANGPTLLAGPRPRTIGVAFRLYMN